MTRGARRALFGFAVAVALALGCSSSPGSDADANLLAQHDGHPGPDGSQGGCGTCPGGYTCGSANGTAVCRAPSGVPLMDHVFVIVMENTTLSRLTASTNTPYLHGLFMTAASSSNYHGVAHPSLPNYVALVSGSTGGIACDCDPTGSACNGVTCNSLLSLCGCPQATTSHLADQLDTASITWKAYAEDMGTPCNLTTSGNYAARHVPFLYLDDVQTDTARCQAHDVDYGTFAADLAAGPPRFTFIAPNLLNDMHSPVPAGAANLATGDTWLMTEVPKILASPAFARGLVVIVWDEDDNSGIPNADDPIPMLVLSPLAKSGGFDSMTHFDHYALLATIEDALGLGRIGMAANATPLAEFFPSQ